MVQKIWNYLRRSLVWFLSFFSTVLCCVMWCGLVGFIFFKILGWIGLAQNFFFFFWGQIINHWANFLFILGRLFLINTYWVGLGQPKTLFLFCFYFVVKKMVLNNDTTI